MDYDDLRDRIGDKLGYGLEKADWTANTDKTARVERILESGLRRFYSPPVLPGERERHHWSFLSPTRTIDILEGETIYSLPESFVMFDGPLTYAPGVTVLYSPVREVGAERVRYELQTSGAIGRPSMFGVRVKDATEIHATEWEMIVYPTPDQDYQVQGQMQINPVVPGATGDLPLGGQPHDQTIIEACLAEWEMFDDYGGTAHQQRFMECLISSVSHDRNVSCPKRAGYVWDPNAYSPVWSKRHDIDEHRTFYNGTET